MRPEEVRATWISCLYFFFILSSYYILRPIRDEIGAANGVDNLPWLFTGTLISMLLVNPLFAVLVSKYPRHKFIPYTYRFFALNLVIFFLLQKSSFGSSIWVGASFFIWVSVFNLFVVSVFWAFMSDIFRNEQSKRLFGFIGIGGTIGGITGSIITSFLVKPLGPVNLLLVSAVMIEIAVQCVFALGRAAKAAAPAAGANAGATADAAARKAAAEEPVGGGILEGIRRSFSSPYLLGVTMYMLLYTIGSTFLYYQQAEIANATFGTTDRAVRTAFFANVDLAVNILTLITQAYFTARFIRWLGMAGTLALLPALSVAGFLALGFWPMLSLFVVFQVSRRAGNYAVARPAREILFTVVSRGERYKAKTFIDTFWYRAGDQIGGWSYTWMNAMGMGMAAISFVAAPLAAIWLFIGLWLGRRQKELRRQQDADELNL